MRAVLCGRQDHGGPGGRLCNQEGCAAGEGPEVAGAHAQVRLPFDPIHCTRILHFHRILRTCLSDMLQYCWRRPKLEPQAPSALLVHECSRSTSALTESDDVCTQLRALKAMEEVRNDNDLTYVK